MRITIALLASLALTSVACGKGSPTNPSETNAETVATTGSITDFVTKVGIPGPTQQNPSTGSAPAPGSGPVATVIGPATINAKDSVIIYNFSSTTAFQKVFVSVPGKSGYFEVPLPAPTLSQNLSIFFNTLPASLTLQFELASASGAVGPVATLSIATTTNQVAALTITANPDPIPFSGRTCTVGSPIDPAQACIFETRMSFQETNGISFTISQYTATWTYGGPATPRVFSITTLPSMETQIFGGQIITNVPVRVSCTTPTCSAAFYAATPGTLSIKVTGTDSAGRAVSFQSKNFVLLAGQ